MKKLIFLRNLKKKKVIELVESSEEIKSSYLTKSENCLKSAKILFKNGLYENSTTEAYYCMYNSLLALLFKAGIKSENHSASIILLDMLIDDEKLVKIISWAKEERIDKQYYVETQQTIKATKESCNEVILKAEDFFLGIGVLINEIGNEKINSIRNSFMKLLD
ncbi:HEPN domain-containing protein [Candidatus Pacearchaeota archaeon]|nr:HEPN domain-containing protein [Candidatus Pacearchaeota archaeon]